MWSIERLGLMAFALVLGSANVARAEEGDGERRSALVAAGATVFSLSYIASAAYATMGYATVDAMDSDRALLFIPWGGPLAMLVKGPTTAEAAMYGADFLFQLGGAAMFVTGLLERPKIGGKSVVSISPYVLPHAAGVVMGGSF